MSRFFGVSFFFLSILGFLHAQPVADEILVTSGLSQPTDITNAGDGSNRLFITEKSGRIKVIQNKQVTGIFLDLSSKVSTTSERGLLGLAFHPNFASNGYLYVNYTGPDVNGTFFSIISRFKVSANNPNLADPSSERIILSFSQPFSNHNGGDLAFGPDGYLYIATGDGGSAGDPQNNSQTLSNLLGKILRIDINTENEPYLIPASNPFLGQVDKKPEIWSYGLRNPWRIAFDRGTGDLWIADVGQGAWEEINIQPAGVAGQNYGWRCFEGSVSYANCPAITHTAPQYVYGHPDAGCADTTYCGRSVTGGYVYRGSQYPSLSGYYFFADYVDKRMWALRMNGNIPTVFRQSSIFISRNTTFGEDQNGELYFATLDGSLYQLISNQVLPVTMVNYKLISSGNQFTLHWETADEIDLDHYLVETSTDLKTIQTVHQESAIGHAKNVYQYHGTAHTSLLYIRLTAVDLDGTKEHFPWKSVYVHAVEPQWYPNPSRQTFSANLSGPFDPRQISVFNQHGKAITHRLTQSYGQYQLDLTGQPPGIYFIHYQSSTQKNVKKIILQHP